MEGFGSLLRLAPVALEALLGVAATAHSGFGLFSGVSFGWGHADLVCIVMRSIPDIRETMSHRVSMSHRMDENLAIMQSHKPCIMNNFHEVASGTPLSCSLIFKFGKASIFRRRQENREDQTVAAVEGTREVGMAIIASTITTLVVFLPVIFVRGVTGLLFQELAYVIIFSLVCSLLVSLSLV